MGGDDVWTPMSEYAETSESFQDCKARRVPFPCFSSSPPTKLCHSSRLEQ